MNLVEILRSDPLPRELAFELPEYERRVRAVQQRMESEGVEFLVVSSTPNLGYLTGYDSTMPSGYTIGILGVKGSVSLHTSELEAPCAFLSSTIEQIDVFYWTEAQDTGAQLSQILSDLGASGKRIGIEMGNATISATGFDTRNFLRLQERLPDCDFVDATSFVLEPRKIKTEAEQAYMRQAGQYTALGLQASIQAAAEGRTDNELVAAGYQAMVSAGSELMSIDPMIVTGARTGYMPHIPYRRVPLKNGDPIYLEYSGCHNRYNAPSMRSAILGEPSDKMKQLADASLNTVDILLDSIAPGRTGTDIALEAKRGLDSAPEGTFFHSGFGYSVGIGYQPTWSEIPLYIAEGAEEELRPGMTFHLPICIWIPAEKIGVGFSETVVVTDSGCDLLTPGKDRHLVVC